MDYHTIDYWMHRFDQMGLFTVSFKEPEYSDLVSDLAEMHIANPMQLIGLIDRCID